MLPLPAHTTSLVERPFQAFLGASFRTSTDSVDDSLYGPIPAVAAAIFAPLQSPPAQPSSASAPAAAAAEAPSAAPFSQPSRVPAMNRVQLSPSLSQHTIQEGHF